MAWSRNLLATAATVALLSGVTVANAAPRDCSTLEVVSGLCPTIDAHAGDDGVTLRGSEHRPGSGRGGVDLPGRIMTPAPANPDLVIR
ncbi:MAG: hypothetical protein ABIW36_07045, partial [Terrimesophilobacter sp.]